MTTRQRHWIAPLVFLFLACVPREALAQWGKIEKLRGPGPFWGVQIPLDRLICVVRPPKGGVEAGVVFRSTGAGDPACATDSLDVRLYLSLEVGRASSFPRDEFPAVALTGVKPVGFFRIPNVGGLMDVGAGIGFNRFSGADFDAFARFSVPLRARIFAPNVESRYRAFYLAVQADYFPAVFTAADFGMATPYVSDHKFVQSWFLGVDVLRLLR